MTDQRRAKRPASEMFEMLSEMASDLFGDEDSQEKDNYITEHMKRLGYRAKMTFEDSDDDNVGGSDFTTSLFSGRRRREVPPRGQSSGRGFGMGGYSG